jgi:hypothetical protein
VRAGGWSELRDAIFVKNYWTARILTQSWLGKILQGYRRRDEKEMMDVIAVARS